MFREPVSNVFKMPNTTKSLEFSTKEISSKYKTGIELIKKARNNIENLINKKQGVDSDKYWQEIVEKINLTFFADCANEEMTNHIMYCILNNIEIDFTNNDKVQSIVFDEEDMRIDKFLNNISRANSMDEIDLLFTQLSTLYNTTEISIQ